MVTLDNNCSTRNLRKKNTPPPHTHKIINVTVSTPAQPRCVQQKVMCGAFSTCSDFDSLWCESPVDVIDEYGPLLLRQIQSVQDGGITEVREAARVYVRC